MEGSGVIEPKFPFLLIHSLTGWSGTSPCFPPLHLKYPVDLSVNCSPLPLEHQLWEDLALVKILHSYVPKA